MELYKILDEMEEMIKSAPRIPLSGKAIIDSEYFLEKVDRLRAILPGEVEEARSLLEEQQKMFAQASKAAQQIIDDSKYQAARIVENSEITKQAESVSREIIARAEQLAQEIRGEASQYAEDLLSYMERVLKEGLGSIQKGRSHLREIIKEEE